MYQRQLLNLLLAGLLAIGALCMAGCGQKGDLYLPDSSDSEQRR